MASNTFTKIATVTVGSGGASTIDFTSIPSTYTDLILFWSARSNRSAVFDDTLVKFNSSTTNYTQKVLYNDSGTTGSYTNGSSLGLAGLSQAAANDTANVFGNAYIYITNYNSSNYKSFSADGTSENNGSGVGQALSANLWSNTSAITSITILPGDGTLFSQYSTATLYGIKNS